MITIGISSVFSKFTKLRSLPADRISSVLLMLFVDARIDQRTECILCRSRNNAVIYWGNGKWNQIKWSFCDKIGDFFSIFQIDKAEKCCCRSHELSPLSCYLLTPALMKEQCILPHCRKDRVIHRTNHPVEPNQPIHSW